MHVIVPHGRGKRYDISHIANTFMVENILRPGTSIQSK